MRRYRHKAMYYETDQMGIIHHSNYIRWMEEARMDYMDAMGIPYKDMEALGIISPVLGIECQYKAMVYFGDTVEIESRITKYNGLRMEVEYHMYSQGKLCFRALSSHCFLDRQGRPLSVKKAAPDMHGRFLEEWAKLEAGLEGEA